MYRSVFSLAAIVAGGLAQTTYTGCHMHGSVSYCFNSNGVELAMTTLASVPATVTTPASVTASTTAAAQTTAVTSCHLHGTNIFCIDGAGDEVSVSVAGTRTGTAVPAAYTGCHAHGAEQFCVDPQGNDVAIIEVSEAGHDHSSGSEASGEMDCHFHAGVE